MKCPNCGQENESGATICMSCGKPISGTGQKAEGTRAPESQTVQEPGRGGLIITLGVLSVVLLGPILGIPAWVMGHRDMKKIHAGKIPVSNETLTKTGMIIGIIGTFISMFTIISIGIVIGVATSLTEGSAQSGNRDEVVRHLNDLAEKAGQYCQKPAAMGGGGGSFVGFKLSGLDASDENGTYQIADEAPSAPGYYNPSAGRTAGNATSLVIVGWGETTGNDGIHKVEGYVVVTQNSVTLKGVN